MYGEEDGRDLDLEEIAEDLERWSNSSARHDFKASLPDKRMYWHVMANLRRNCRQLRIEVPMWLDSLLESAPPEDKANPKVILA